MSTSSNNDEYTRATGNGTPGNDTLGDRLGNRPRPMTIAEKLAAANAAAAGRSQAPQSPRTAQPSQPSQPSQPAQSQSQPQSTPNPQTIPTSQGTQNTPNTRSTTKPEPSSKEYARPNKPGVPPVEPPRAPREPQKPEPSEPHKKKSPLLWLLIVVAALLIGGGGWFYLSWSKQQKALEEAQLAMEQMQLDREQEQLEREYEDLNNEFSQFENQRNLILDDSVKRALTEKYETARLQIEKLQKELKDNKQRSAAEISKLKSEIETLRNLIKHYLEEINRLNQENQALRTENAEIKDENKRLSTRVEETSRKNEVLSERMTLAERLNVTNVSLTPLNKKGKNEKKVEKAIQLRVVFTIPQNNSTPVGEKTIYLRLVSPSGQMLGNGGSFSFEGTSLACTARKTVEYSGEELTGVTIYYDVNTPLTPGDYTVELFADNFRLTSKHFNLK